MSSNTNHAFVVPVGAPHRHLSTLHAPRSLPTRPAARRHQAARRPPARVVATSDADDIHPPSAASISSSSVASTRLSWPKSLVLAASAALSTAFPLAAAPSPAAATTLSFDTRPPTPAVVTSTRVARRTATASTPAAITVTQPVRQTPASIPITKTSSPQSITTPSNTTTPTTRSHLAPLALVSTTPNRTSAASRAVANSIPLDALDMKREDFLSERELRRRKTTQFSEAEQEIMELEEWEVDTQWFRDLQTIWAAIASVAGIFILYKGGVMWENWIKEQERKDMEEEIELTGTFIDPRAVRKEEDDDGSKTGTKKPSDGGNKPGKGPKGGNSGKDAGDAKQGGDIESLEKLFGNS